MQGEGTANELAVAQDHMFQRREPSSVRRFRNAVHFDANEIYAAWAVETRGSDRIYWQRLDSLGIDSPNGAECFPYLEATFTRSSIRTVVEL